MNKKNRIALVTGGSQGIGRQISIDLAKDGYKVIIVNNSNLKNASKVVEEIKKDGGKVFSYRCNLEYVYEIELLIKKINLEIGTVDILINNAAVFNPKPLEKITENDWDKELNVNLKACFFLIKALVPDMKKQKWGKIINISSIAGSGGFPNSSHYCASKGGINNMTKALCLELSKFGININVIAPGNIITPMNKKLRNDPDWCNQLRKRTPTGDDFLDPKEISGAVKYLISNEAKYVHGIVLPVDAGWTAW